MRIAILLLVMIGFGAAAFAQGQWSEPVAVTPQLGTAVWGPWISNDGLRLYASGGGYLNVIERDSVAGPWHAWHWVSDTINSGMRQESPAESPSGDTLYFMSFERPEGSYGWYDIYYSVRNDSGDWGPAINCGPNINTPDDEWSVGISRDGGTLLVSAHHMPVSGGRDLFYSEKQPDGTWGPLVNYGPYVNSIDDDEHPSMPLGNNAIYFYKMGPRMGDIWVSERVNGMWQEEVDLPAPVNTLMGRQYDPCISADGRTLWFIYQDDHGDNTLYYSLRTDTLDAQEPRTSAKDEVRNLGVRVDGNRLILGISGNTFASRPSVSIYDILGRQSLSSPVLFAPSAQGAVTTLTIGSLPAGAYFVQLRGLNSPLVGKFIIR
jgi:hypothetical protein